MNLFEAVLSIVDMSLVSVCVCVYISVRNRHRRLGITFNLVTFSNYYRCWSIFSVLCFWCPCFIGIYYSWIWTNRYCSVIITMYSTCSVVKSMILWLRHYSSCSMTWFGQTYIFVICDWQHGVEVVGKWRSSVRNCLMNVLILKKFVSLFGVLGLQRSGEGGQILWILL